MKHFLALCMIFCTHLSAIEPTKEGAVLEATLNILPATPINAEDRNIIQPGTPVIIAAVVKNVGSKPNTPGIFFVRFLYPSPLNNQQNSTLYTTEKVDLPSIPPGSTAALAFKTPQSTPSLFDFIRQDWSLRQYEAVAVIDDKEYILGNSKLTFSAYYYPGASHELPTLVPNN